MFQRTTSSLEPYGTALRIIHRIYLWQPSHQWPWRSVPLTVCCSTNHTKFTFWLSSCPHAVSTSANGPLSLLRQAVEDLQPALVHDWLIWWTQDKVSLSENLHSTALLFSNITLPRSQRPRSGVLFTGSVIVNAPSQRAGELKAYRVVKIFTNQQSRTAEKS